MFFSPNLKYLQSGAADAVIYINTKPNQLISSLKISRRANSVIRNGPESETEDGFIRLVCPDDDLSLYISGTFFKKISLFYRYKTNFIEITPTSIKYVQFWKKTSALERLSSFTQSGNKFILTYTQDVASCYSCFKINTCTITSSGNQITITQSSTSPKWTSIAQLKAYLSQHSAEVFLFTPATPTIEDLTIEQNALQLLHFCDNNSYETYNKNSDYVLFKSELFPSYSVGSKIEVNYIQSSYYKSRPKDTLTHIKKDSQVITNIRGRIDLIVPNVWDGYGLIYEKEE